MRQSREQPTATVKNIDKFFADLGMSQARMTLLMLLNNRSGKHGVTHYQYTPESKARFEHLAKLAKKTKQSLNLMAPLDDHTMFEIGVRCAKEISELNRLLEQTKFVPHLWVAAAGRSLHVRYVTYATDLSVLFESIAIRGLCEVISSGDLDRLGKCDVCATWFLAHRNDKQTCSPKCRQERHSKTPEFKAKRRDYLANRESSKFIVQSKKRKAQGGKNNGK